jgi:hypothetical protein
MNKDVIDFEAIALKYGLHLAKRLLILLIGLWGIKFVMKLYRKS